MLLLCRKNLVKLHLTYGKMLTEFEFKTEVLPIIKIGIYIGD